MGSDVDIGHKSKSTKLWLMSTSDAIFEILSLLLWPIGSDTIMKYSTCMIIVANLHWTQFIIESDDKIGYNNCLDIEADWHLL